MRPVEKLKPSDAITYRNSNDEEVNCTIVSEYPNYKDAKQPLAANIGQYCSYCECKCAMANMEVEHIQPKGEGGSTTSWDNFLLGCKICNTVKSDTIPGTSYHWPHHNNTFMDFVYDKTGRISVNKNIPKESRKNAQSLLDLLKLQRHPSEDKPSKCDFRWRGRFEAWNTATRQLALYEQGCLNVNDIIRLAQNIGHWSIWFTVFKGKDAVLEHLISDFPGTSANCFDAANHYVPIYRNPSNTNDPV